MAIVEGWKIVRPDGTTHGGYAWPLVNAKAGQKPVQVRAVPVDGEFRKGDSCPSIEGDGLCLAKTARGASSGGIRLAECVGLHVTYNTRDILGEDDDKVRVKACTVVGIWSPLAVIRQAGPLKDANLRGADLRGANLRGANLWGANLWGANLRGANLWDADLRGANLRGANLWDANLRGANLRGANLWDANLWDADLRGANLRGANLRGADLRGANLRGANLWDANLWDANLWGARTNGRTSWPIGFDPTSRGVA